MYQSKKPYLYGTGRRKSSVARVHLFPNGTGSITVNGRSIDEYFGLDTLKMLVRQPLEATGNTGKMDVVATVTGGGLAAPLTAQATLAAAQRADLTVSKAICPATVTESGQLTYTFVLQNFGNTAATAGDNVILTDTFDPALTGLTVTYNGDTWKEGDNYTYDAATGTFATIAGQIAVPAATYTQETDGTYTVTPGTTTVTVTGTV